MRPSHANPFLEPGDVKPDAAPVEAKPLAGAEAASTREPIAVATVEEDARVPAAMRALQDGRAFTVIVENDPHASARAVADLAGKLKAQGVPVTVVGNVTPWPLTLDKLIAQVGGEPGSDPEQLLREAMAGPFSEPGRAVLAIDQADTLDDCAMRFLADLSKVLRANGAKFQLVFAGPDALLHKLSGHGFVAPSPLAARLLGTPRAGLAAMVAACVVVLAVVGSSATGGGARQAPTTSQAASQPTTAAAAPAAETPAAMQAAEPAGAMTAQAPAASAPPIVSAPPSAPEPVPALAPSPAPTLQAPASIDPAPSAPLAPSERVRETALQHEFGAFLDRSGVQTAKLTPAQRDQLFKDYLVWRLRPSAISGAPNATPREAARCGSSPSDSLDARC